MHLVRNERMLRNFESHLGAKQTPAPALPVSRASTLLATHYSLALKGVARALVRLLVVYRYRQLADCGGIVSLETSHGRVRMPPPTPAMLHLSNLVWYEVASH